MPNLLPMYSQISNPLQDSLRYEDRLLREKDIIKSQIETGQIPSFHHLFDIYTRPILILTLYLIFSDPGKKINDPGQFSVEDIYLFADFFKLDVKVVFEFFYKQFETSLYDRKTI